LNEPIESTAINRELPIQGTAEVGFLLLNALPVANEKIDIRQEVSSDADVSDRLAVYMV